MIACHGQHAIANLIKQQDTNTNKLYIFIRVLAFFKEYKK